MATPNEELFERAKQKRQDELAEQPVVPKAVPEEIAKGFRIGKQVYEDLGPPGYRQTALEDLPNMDKLSNTERAVINWLPGFSEGTIGKALAKFGESPFGKLLQIFDIGAEAVERGTGLIAQGIFAAGQGPEGWDQFQQELGSAWYAGGLAADMANLPQIHGLFDFLNKNAPKQSLGMSFPTDLPGVEGLVIARQQIDELTREGMDPGEALELVRDEYYNGLDALAIRAQANDLFMHLFADPINIILPHLKLVERTQVGLLNRLWRKAIPQDVADDIARFTDELAEARKIGDKVRITELEEALEVRNFTKNLGPWEQRILKTMNAIPGEEPKLPGLLKFIGKPFQLTPESRAHALVTNVGDNLLVRIIGPGDDEAQIVRSIERMADGTLGPEFGHMVVSVEGRTVRAVAQDVAAAAKKKLGTYQATTYERNLLGMVSDVIGEPPAKTIQRILDGEDAMIFQQFSENLQDTAILERLLATRGLTLDALSQDDLAKAASLYKDWPVFDLNTFKASLMLDVGESTAKAGISLYGVKARGTLQAMSEAVKSAETLAFLRMNPAYPIKNWLNNNTTMLARGTFGRIGKNFGANFWKRWGEEPLRLRVGIGPAGLFGNEGGRVGAAALEAAGKLFQEARVPNPGWTDRVSNMFKGINLGKLDTGSYGQGMEAASSVRGTTAGVQRGMSIFWKPTKVEDFSVPLADALGPDVTRAFQRSLKGVVSPQELEDLFFKKNLNITQGMMMEEASEQFGGNINRILTEEFTNEIMPGLENAANKGPSAVRKYMFGLREEVQTHIDDLVDESIGVMRSEAEALVETEGPQAFLKLWGDQIDEFYGVHSKWARDVSRMSRAAREADPKVADAIWKQSQFTGDRYFTRAFDRFEARMDGMVEASRRLEMPFADDVMGAFKNWRKEWLGYIRTRNRLHNEFFEAELAGNKPKLKFEFIQDQLDELYLEKIGIEDGFMNQIDEAVSTMLPEDQRELFMGWRDAVAEFRRADREEVLAFRQVAKDLPENVLEAAWKSHWQRRQELWAQIVGEERAGLAAMQGDQQAAARYAGRGAQEVAEEVAEEAPEAFAMQGLPDFHSLVGREMYMGTGVDQLWFTRGDDALSAIENAALDLRKRPPIRFDNLPAEQQGALRTYATHLKGEMSDARYQSVKFGEWMRDSALLNYNRRYNYNTFLGVLAPYEFWFTQSVYKWALHSIDRPAMLSSYLKIQQFLDTAYRPEEGLPSRLRGSIRIPTPFLDDWLGNDIFIDPMRTALPFQQFAFPFEELLNQGYRDEGAATRALESLVNDGKITEEEYAETLSTKSGPLWDRAVMLARQWDTEGRLNGFDFAAMLTQPHAPLMWAYNALKGDKEDIQPFLPITRSIRGATALLGIPFPNTPLTPPGGLNIESGIRQAIGLPAFDKWDDYRIDRMLSNMTAQGEINVEEALRAMIEREGPAFIEAQRKAGIEFGIGAMGSTLGMPIKAYPEGEEFLRDLRGEYEGAWQEYEGGDLKALTRFYERHPEYETRLALFKTPEERLRNFITGEIWDWWNDAPKVHKDEVKQHLGPLFRDAFLDKDTRSIDAIPLEAMQVWLKIIGGDPPGQVHFTETLTPLEFAPREDAQRVQVFYDTRDQVFRYGELFPEFWNTYFNLDTQGRRQYRRENQLFSQYLNFRDDFMLRNPSIAPYIEDDPSFRPKFRSERELTQAYGLEPNFTRMEWQTLFGGPLTNLVDDLLFDGEGLPTVGKNVLERIADDIGLADADEIIEYYAASR